MTCERRRELNLHRREASCLQGDVITGYKYLQGNNGDRGSELFTGARWQDMEQARPGRGELAPWGHPELEPGCGAAGQGWTRPPHVPGAGSSLAEVRGSREDAPPPAAPQPGAAEPQGASCQQRP